MEEKSLVRDLDLANLARLDPVTAGTARRCANCGRCGAACRALLRDPSPAGLLRLLQLGRVDEALTAPLLWACTGCRQCSACCPQDLDVAAAVVRLRRLAARHPEADFSRFLFRWFTG